VNEVASYFNDLVTNARSEHYEGQFALCPGMTPARVLALLQFFIAP
jgi:hypothetical protein